MSEIAKIESQNNLRIENHLGNIRHKLREIMPHREAILVKLQRAKFPADVGAAIQYTFALIAELTDKSAENQKKILAEHNQKDDGANILLVSKAMRALRALPQDQQDQAVNEADYIAGNIRSVFNTLGNEHWSEATAIAAE